MGLLAPAMLAGLAALAVPLLLHLVDLGQRDPRRFPSLMFVRRLPQRSERLRRLRDPLLLVLRCLALVLLVLAFARPWTAAVQAAPAHDAVLLLDRSASMGGGERWPRALAAARRWLDSAGPDTRAALVVFDQRAETLVGLDADHRRLHAALAATGPGEWGTDLAAGLDAAHRLLAASGAARRSVLLVSDLRQPTERIGALRLPEGVTLEVVDVGGEPLPGLWPEVRELTAGAAGRPGRLALALQAAEALPTEPAELRVLLGQGVLAARQGLGAEAAGTTLDLPLPAATGTAQRLSVQVSGAGAPGGHHLHLLMPPEATLHVLLVAFGDELPAAERYLRRALALAPELRLEVLRDAPLAAALAAADVLVADQAVLAEPGARAALRARVEQGAGLLLVASRAAGRSWPAEAGWLPGRSGAEHEAGAGVALDAAWQDPAHALAAAWPGDAAAELLATGARRYRVLEPAAGAGVLARFEDGAPALLEGVAGAGRVLQLALGLDRGWGELVTGPAFVPLLVESVRYLAGAAPPRPAVAVGQPVDLARHAAGFGAAALAAHLRAGGELVVRLPNGDSRRVADGVLVPAAAGFHELHASGAGLPPLPLAVNVDPAETAAPRLEPAALSAAVRRLPAPPGAAMQARRLAETGGDRAWFWLLAGALLALAAESRLAARLARSAPGTGAKA